MVIIQVKLFGQAAGIEQCGSAGPYGGGSSRGGTTEASNAQADLYLPLPFFFSRDSGVSLPTAALPYNEIKMEFTFRNAADLLYTLSAAAPGAVTAGAASARVQQHYQMFKFGLTML